MQELMIRAERAISIHAPAKGATQSGDHGSGGNAISIHAPAKGATPKAETGYKPCQYFNPRSREGSDRIRTDKPMILTTFQSTLPRRERRSARVPLEHPGNFNPRSREGSDGRLSRGLSKQVISIHAPAKGATA